MSDLFSQPFEDDPGELEAPARRAAGRRIQSVSEVTAALRQVIESRFAEIWVEGEISNCRVSATGHAYFTLKDDGAQLKVVMFRSAVRYLRFAPEDGLHVIARGRLGLYESRGEYQLQCEHLQPHGVGEQQLAFEQLKKKLAAEGLFDAGRKRPLPALPRKIGIVTSLEGAALHDIVKVLRRRHPNAYLVVRPARVQGEGAAGEIARGLRAIGRVPGIDVVIVGRGGGSAEDLWAFNQEVVARAIAASPIPVVAAVGHEVDFTIADFVADLRAPTPSAAAELVVAAKDEFCARIDRLSQRLRGAVVQGLQRRRQHVAALAQRRGLAGWPARVALKQRDLGELGSRLRQRLTATLQTHERRIQALGRRLEARNVHRQLANLRGRLGTAETRLAAAADRRTALAAGRMQVLTGRLHSLSPLAVLGRGYAVCWDATRTRIIRDARTLTPGDGVTITLQHGEARCEVRSTSEP